MIELEEKEEIVAAPIPEIPVADGQQLLEEIVNGKKLVVEADLWHRLAYLLMTHPEQLTLSYTPQARLIMLGRVRGGETLDECSALWDETKKWKEDK